MALHSLHHYASSVRHKTAKSLRSVFSSHGHSKSSPGLVSLSNETFLNSDSRPGREKELSNFRQATTRNHHERIFDAFDGDSSGDEGYVTASEECREYEDRDSDDSSDEATKDARRTEDGMHEGVSTGYSQKREVPSRSNGYHSELAVSELHTVTELRDSVIYSEPEERLKKVDDATLMRFLKARNMDVAKASEMFLSDWRWRTRFAPKGFIAESEIPNQLKAEKAFLQGLDKRGRPLMIVVGAKHFSKGRDMEEFKRYCYFCIEKVIARDIVYSQGYKSFEVIQSFDHQSMPEGVEQFVTIFDAGSTGYRNMDTSASLIMVDFLQAHYPERMSRLFLLHVSSLFQGTYRLVEPTVDVNTRKKIRFLSDKDMEPVLKEEIGEECLPKAYGGTADFVPIQYAQINKQSYPCRAVSSQ